MKSIRPALIASTVLVLVATLVSCGSDDTAATPATATIDPPFTVKVIGLNDFHGNLESPGTFSADTTVVAASRPAVGGADFMAAYVAKLKGQNTESVVVGAGDLIGATPLISAAFSDEPAVEVLNRIGLEFTAVGNHEFDSGSAELLRLQNGGCKIKGGIQDPNSCKGASVGTPVPFEGAKFKWLSANVLSTTTNKPLLPAYGIKTFKGVKMAFIGMTLKATPTIVTPTGVAGLSFEDEAQTVNNLIPELKAQGIEAIGVLIHEGGFQTGTLGAINGCEGNLAGSALAAIVKKLDNAVDFVVSGHTHSAYNCKLPNATGRLISVTSSSAFGRVLTDIDVIIDPATKDISLVTATNRLVDRTDTSITADAKVAAVVAGYKGLVSPVANALLGSITKDLPISRDSACNMTAGNLIADAQLNATKTAGFGEAVIALMNGGGVRSPGFTFTQSAANEGNGNVTYGEGFTVQPFGNSLVTLTLTAQNLKNLLEEQFAGCRGQSATATRFMLPSAGFKYRWDGSKACDSRISNVALTVAGVTESIVDSTGTVLNPTKTYRVTVNNFMADGGDGYATLLAGTNRLGGAQDIDALVAYLGQFKAPLAPYDPAAVIGDAGAARISRVGGTACPTGVALNP
jgi:5'-nucleotidase